MFARFIMIDTVYTVYSFAFMMGMERNGCTMEDAYKKIRKKERCKMTVYY